jgi:hypothetical protein
MKHFLSSLLEKEIDSGIASLYDGAITEKGGGPVQMISGSSNYGTLTTREVADS